MLSPPLAPWPIYDEEQIAAVGAVLRSGRVNQWTGTNVRNFESELACWTGSDHAVALANGSVALDVALKACGIGPGDEVIVTPRTFIASASSVVVAGATPVFCDVDRESGNITAATIAPLIGPLTRAIIPVHLGGWPCEMSEIMALATRHGLVVIEDCAQAHGASHRGRSVGSWGNVGAWSFCQDKIMTTGGEGGAVTTNDRALWQTMWSYKDHGKDFDEVYRADHPPGFRWLHRSIGTNWRMTEMQAAIGRVQLRRMTDWTKRRNELASVFYAAVSESGETARAPRPNLDDVHAYYRFYCYVQPTALATGWDRDRIIAEAADLGLPLFQGSCSEVYRERAFDHAPGRPAKPLPVAAELGATSLMALVHPTISDDEIDRCANALRTVLRRARR